MKEYKIYVNDEYFDTVKANSMNDVESIVQAAFPNIHDDNYEIEEMDEVSL